MSKLVLLCVLLSGVTAHAADATRSISATFTGGAMYPPGRWVPISVRLTNTGAEAVDGGVTITPQSDPDSVIVRRDVHVPARSSLTVEMLGMFPDAPINPKQKVVDTGTVVWTAAHGSQRIEEPLLGLSDASVRHNGQESTNLPGVLMLSITGRLDSDDRRDASDLAALLSTQVNYAFDPNNVDIATFPRHAEALDGARLIAIDPTLLAGFDAAQRDALLTAVRGGVTVLLTAPDAAAATSFLGPYLPLDVLGTHYVSALHPIGWTDPLPMLKPVDIADVAVRDGAVVTLADARGPLAAYRPVGFGRVVMTAFCPHDLADAPEIAAAWADLIGVGNRAFHDAVALSTKPQAAAVLPEMIGASAPPWSVAAAVVGGYVAVVAVLLLVSGQGRRPLAMAGSVGVAVLLTGALLGFTQFRSTGQPLMVGRVTTLDLTGDSAARQDIVTFFGRQRGDLTIDLPDGATAKPAVTGGTPTLSLWPSAVSGIGASAGKLESVWQIDQSCRSPFEIDARVTFGPGGATLTTDNGAGQPLSGVRLFYGGSVVPLPGVAAGQSEQIVGPRNAAGIFDDNAAVLAGEESKLRTRLVALLSTPPRTPSGITLTQTARPPVLGGFIKEGPGFGFAETSQSHDQTFVRTTLLLQTPAVGQTVRIDPVFTTLRTDYAAGIPYLPGTTSWYANNLSGSWLFAIAAPPRVGRLRPRQIDFDIDARAGSYHVALRRGQCAAGKVQENPAGDLITEWNNQSGRKSVVVDLADSDIDANGWVWLRLQVDSVQTGGLLGDPGVGGEWQITRFDPTLTGTIDAAPQPTIHTWPYPPNITKAAPRPAAKKPAVKPAKPATQPMKKK